MKTIYGNGGDLIGKKVRMTKEYKEKAFEGSQEHIEEFGECVGIVEGLVDYTTFLGPEVDVRWEPSKLRYMYAPEHLEVVKE